MQLLVNPAGRIVEIDDPDIYQRFLKQVGFRIPSTEEEEKYTIERKALYDTLTKPQTAKEDADVYFRTVTQGAGKDGYGIASACILHEVEKAGIKMSLNAKQQKVGLLFHAPYDLIPMETQFRILYTMFESDKLPDNWRNFLEVADLILVPSKWCSQVFEKFGFNAKIVPLGYDQETFQYIPRINKRENRQDFVFLHYNAFNLRKGFVETFKAFNKAFTKDEPVKMIFKTTLTNPPLPIVKSEYPNIIVETGQFEKKEMMDLMAKSDCFVFPSRGEGFGMTPLEAMATGMPAIVPNAHGITEYFNRDYMYEVQVKETCPGIYSRYKGQDVGKMVICDVDHLAQQMRYVYEHQDQALEVGRKASEYVKQWTFEKTGITLKNIIQDYLDKPVLDRPIKNILRLEEVTSL